MHQKNPQQCCRRWRLPWPIVIIILGLAYAALLRYKAGCVYYPPSDLNVKGKTALVTGANTGIGLITAQELAGLGVNVILACRNTDLCKKAAEKVKTFAKEKNSDANVFTEELDLSSLANVRDCAKRVIKTYPKLHYLVNNAGVMALPVVQRTKDGHEMHFGVNHLGHFLLTQILLPHMKTTNEEVRIVNVASMGHHIFIDRINFTDPGNTQTYTPFSSYAVSKLANVLHARELARRENVHLDGRKEKPQVVAVSLHPGAVATELSRHMPPVLDWVSVNVASYIFYKTAWQGSQTSLHCVLDPSVALYNGAYYSDCVPKVTSYGAQSNDDARDLWRLSEELVAPFLA